MRIIEIRRYGSVMINVYQGKMLEKNRGWIDSDET